MRIEESKPFDRAEVESQLTALGVEFTPGAHHKTLLKLLDNQRHTITQEDLDNNPDLVAEGAEVGDEVYLPVATEEEKALEAVANDEQVAEEPVEAAPESSPEAPEEAAAPSELEDGTFTVKTPLKRDGRIYQAGETVELSGTEAKMLIELGVIA